LLSSLFGLFSAFTYGAGDFAGGLSSRRIGAELAVFYAEVVGSIVLFAAVPIIKEPVPGLNVFLLSLVSGVTGTFALMALYQSMASGNMSIAAPVSGLMAAVLPIIIGAFTEGLPTLFQFIGFGFALIAVWYISQKEGDDRPHIERLADLRLPFVAGIGFGLYFVVVHQATQHATLWPMVVSRSGGMLSLLIFFMFRRKSLRITRSVWPFVLANAILDLGGNLFYVLAGQIGRMDVAAVLSALYPGVTVLMAWLFLKEHIGRSQAFGIVAALIAIVLMTL
jgi:drug/metabolite transporter (DMT)-like permease